GLVKHRLRIHTDGDGVTRIGIPILLANDTFKAVGRPRSAYIGVLAVRLLHLVLVVPGLRRLHGVEHVGDQHRREAQLLVDRHASSSSFSGAGVISSPLPAVCMFTCQVTLSATVCMKSASEGARSLK